jgi:hypothetical protein
MIDWDEVTFVLVVVAMVASPCAILGIWWYFARDRLLKKFLGFGFLAGVSWPFSAALGFVVLELACKLSGIDRGPAEQCVLLPDTVWNYLYIFMAWAPAAFSGIATLCAFIRAICLLRA